MDNVYGGKFGHASGMYDLTASDGFEGSSRPWPRYWRRSGSAVGMMQGPPAAVLARGAGDGQLTQEGSVQVAQRLRATRRFTIDRAM